MTLLLATNSGSLDQVVTIGPDAAALVNSNNSYMDVSAGEQLTLRQLLYGLMLPGGNDAALAIADAISGGEPAFVSTMNLYALQLGLNKTHFVSADGVIDANISSARDLAILTAIAIQQPGVSQITATRYLVIPQDVHAQDIHALEYQRPAPRRPIRLSGRQRPQDWLYVRSGLLHGVFRHTEWPSDRWRHPRRSLRFRRG